MHELHSFTLRPEGPPLAQLIFLHGYGDYGGRYVEALTWLAEKGIVCHAFDFRGHGCSFGRRGYIEHWEDYLKDLRDWLKSDGIDFGLPSFVMGHSHGGLVLAAALQEKVLPRIDGAIFMSPYFGRAIKVPKWKLVLVQFLNRTIPWIRMSSGIQYEWLSGDPTMIEETKNDPLYLKKATPRWFCTTEAKQKEVLARAAEIEVPLIIFFGDADPIASMAASQRFMKGVSSRDTEWVSMSSMRHELLRDLGREEVLKRILEWIKARI